MTVEETKSGISRRDLIKKGAVAGAIVWTVPMIETVPAYAATGSVSGSGACSYVTLVYTVTTTDPITHLPVTTTYADKVNADGSCAGNVTANDQSFCYDCNGVMYDNLGGVDSLRANCSVLPSAGAACANNNYFSVTNSTSGSTISANPGTGVTILFAVAHSGANKSGGANYPGNPPKPALCSPTTYTCGSTTSGQNKLSVACGSSVAFTCTVP